MGNKMIDYFCNEPYVPAPTRREYVWKNNDEENKTRSSN